MTRLAFPLLLIATAIALFVLYTNPTYQEVKTLRAQADLYATALNKSEELRAIRDQLLSRRKTFSTEDLAKLSHTLPDNVDNIRLIIEINNVAARHGLSLSNVSLGEISDSAARRNALAVGASGSAVGSVEIGFSVVSTYDNFVSFLQDLEHSQRLIDVEKISFAAGGKDADSYAVTIRTYWLH